MMYTDLALEAAELRMRGLAPSEKLEGVESGSEQIEGFAVYSVIVRDKKGEEAIGKPCGRYVTVDITQAVKREEDSFPRACRAVAHCLEPMLPQDEKAPVLVAGLGNRAITPDAVGPDCIRWIMVTRHMVERMPQYFGSYRPVSAAAPGVLGTTGIETAEFLRALVRDVKPGAVIAVDALMSRRMERLCSTIQICDTGVAPGSGLGGNCVRIDSSYLSVPVIALGIPTIIDSATLTLDTMEEAGIKNADEDAVRKAGNGYIVTHKEIDRLVKESARILAYGINMALHKGIDTDDIEAFVN